MKENDMRIHRAQSTHNLPRNLVEYQPLKVSSALAESQPESGLDVEWYQSVIEAAQNLQLAVIITNDLADRESLPAVTVLVDELDIVPLDQIDDGLPGVVRLRRLDRVIGDGSDQSLAGMLSDPRWSTHVCYLRSSWIGDESEWDDAEKVYYGGTQQYVLDVFDGDLAPYVLGADMDEDEGDDEEDRAE